MKRFTNLLAKRPDDLIALAGYVYNLGGNTYHEEKLHSTHDQ